MMSSRKWYIKTEPTYKGIEMCFADLSKASPGLSTGGKKWDIGLGKIFKGCFDLVAGEIIIRHDFKLPFMNPKILIQIAMF